MEVELAPGGTLLDDADRISAHLPLHPAVGANAKERYSVLEETW